MVPVTTVIACVITLFVSLVLPIVVMVIFAAKNKNQGIGSAWWLGAAGFFVTQIIIRVPVLTILQSQSWFINFANTNPLIYSFVLAFTAGLFELAGRFIVAKLMSKKLTFKRSMAAGLGHGGIEAMLLTGMTYVNNLIFIIMINIGVFDKLIVMTSELAKRNRTVVVKITSNKWISCLLPNVGTSCLVASVLYAAIAI